MMNLLEEISKHVIYDPESGAFTRKITSGKSKCGNRCDYLNNNGYRIVSIAGNKYYAHRLAWLISFGYMPENFIDHINRDRSDNRIVNIRKCDYSENAQNRPKPKGKYTSKHIGVFYDKNLKKFRSSIKKKGIRIWLGAFESEKDAAEAYMKAKEMHHPFRGRHT